MSAESSNVERAVIVEVSPQTKELVEASPQTNEIVDAEMVGETDEVKRETKALIDAIKKRAQAEIQSAGNLTRDAYLKAVRQAREAVERDRLIQQDRIEQAAQAVQKEAEKNWLVILGEIESFGIRLAEMAKRAWEAIVKRPVDSRKH